MQSGGLDEQSLEVGAAFVHPLLECVRALDVNAIEERSFIKLDRVRVVASANEALELDRVHPHRRLRRQRDLGLARGDRVAAKHTTHVRESLGKRMPRPLLVLVAPEHLRQRITGPRTAGQREDNEHRQLSTLPPERGHLLAVAGDRQPAERRDA